MEFDIMNLLNIAKNLGIVLSIPLIRSVSGWAVNALKDNVITRFEYKELLSTVIRVGTMGVIGYFGLSVLGIDNAALTAGIGSFFADKIFNAFKK